MPFLQKELSVLNHDPSDFRQLMAPEASDIRHHYGFEPELCIASSMRHVDMGRLASLQAEEEEPIPSDPQ